MSLASQSEKLTAQFSAAEVGDYLALLKPRVMSLVVFTAFVGLVLAPVPMHPVMAFTALLCIAVGAGAAGALEHVVRRRHRCAHAAHQRAADSGRAHTARRGAWLRPAARRLLGGDPVIAGESHRRRAACLHHLLLCCRLYDVAKALDAAEHRHRRRCRRFPADDRLGGGDRRHQPESVLLFLIIFFWTPPHFWALSLYRADDYARAGIPMLPWSPASARRAGRS